jgi:hypothetical protein
MTDEVMSPLRRRVIEDMTIRKLTPKTQQGYVRTIKNLAAFIGRSPDKASFEDVRRFQLHLVAKGSDTPTLNHTAPATQSSQADMLPLPGNEPSHSKARAGRPEGQRAHPTEVSLCHPPCSAAPTRSSNDPPRSHRPPRTRGSSMKRRDVLRLLSGVAASCHPPFVAMTSIEPMRVAAG